MTRALTHVALSLASLIVYSIAAPGAAAQVGAPVVVDSSVAPAVEYALYIGEGFGGARTLATPTSAVRGKNWAQFAERLGVARFPSYPQSEPAFFSWLGAQGWSLVQCTRQEETTGLLGDRDDVTRCWFRREAPRAIAER